MNAYLTSPVTVIVMAVVLVAAIIAIVLTVRSNHRKERAWNEERRAMDKRISERIAAEREGRDRSPRRAKPKPPLPLPVGRRRSPGSVQRSAPVRSRSTDVDHFGLFIPSLIVTDMMTSDPSPSRDSGSHSSHDSGGGYSGGSDSGGSSGGDSGGSSGGGGGGE